MAACIGKSVFAENLRDKNTASCQSVYCRLQQLTLMSAQLLLCSLHREREKVKMGHRKKMKIYEKYSTNEIKYQVNGDMGLHGGRYSGWVTDRDDSRGFACYSVLAKNERP